MQSIKRRLKFFSLGVLLVSIVILVLLKILDIVYPFQFPEHDKSFAQLVLDQNNHPLRAFADESGVWRQKVSLEEVSEVYVEALLAYEDRYFWKHPGVNPVAIFRAMRLNASCDCIQSGGSTLTMQVARRFHPHKRNIKGKLSQVLRALQLEWHLDKKEIMELYLNYAPFGGTVEGVQAASYAYLNKPADQLTHAEAALLAVLPQAPSRMRPDRYPERARIARDKVLQRLNSFGIWDANIIVRAKQEQVIAQQPKRPKFAPLLARKLKNIYPNQQSIQTTLDFDLQRGLEDQLKNWINNQPKHSSVAVLVTENKTMQVKAYIGSAEFNDSERFGHVDMVKAIRSPGSTLKPFIYGMAIDQGLIHSHSLLSDAPRHYADYRPQNFNNGFSGPVSVTEALQRSLNVPAVQVMSQLGPKRFHSSMRSAGIDLKLPNNSTPNLSIALGGTGVTLWDLVKVYSALANGGQVRSMHVLPNKIDKQEADKIESIELDSRYLMSPQAAWISFQMLANNRRSDRAINENLIKEHPNLAWKTGTSYGYRDAWAIGTSNDYTVGIWLGRPDGTPQPGHYGALNAAPLLFRISDVLEKQNPTKIKKPLDVELKDICWPLGKAKDKTPATQCHKVHEAWLSKNLTPVTFPEKETENWVSNPIAIWTNSENGLLVDKACAIPNKEKSHIALWPKSLEPWVAKHWSRRGQIPLADSACETPPELAVSEIKIIGIDKSNVYRSPRSGSDMPLVSLEAIGGIGTRDWFVNGRYIFSSDDEQAFPFQFQRTGKQQIVVIDQQGSVDEVSVLVEEGV